MALDKRPFNMTGPTVLVAGAGTAPTGVQALAVGATPAENYRIQNNGTVTAFVAFGKDASTAQTNAVIPTAGNSKNSFPVPPGAIEVVSANVDCYWSAITATGTASVYVTPGMGY